MRIQLNLASNPYEVAREYTRRMTLLLGGLGVVAVVLLGYIVYQRSQTRDIDHQISMARTEIAVLDEEKAQAKAILNQPQNRDIAEQSEFLNSLFARKGLSWTKVFMEMETLMPPNIHVMALKPEFNRQNQLVLHVVVATTMRDKAVELVRRMEKSPRFQSPQVEAETTLNEGTAGQSAGTIQFDVAAVYVPGADEPTKDEKPASPDDATKPTGQKPAKVAAAPAAKAGPVAGGAR